MMPTNSRQRILQQLKTRGPQSVKILAKQMDMTTMGVRQHLADLASAGFVAQTQEAHQTRGRPLHLWRLTADGHRQFTDSHGQFVIQLLDLLRQHHGDQLLSDLSRHQLEQQVAGYQLRLAGTPDELEPLLQQLVRLRCEDGYMAELRMLPQGAWLLIENHCPLYGAASHCPELCQAELELFRTLLRGVASLERTDHAVGGDRRCAYRIVPIGHE